MAVFLDLCLHSLPAEAKRRLLGRHRGVFKTGVQGAKCFCEPPKLFPLGNSDEVCKDWALAMEGVSVGKMTVCS